MADEQRFIDGEEVCLLKMKELQDIWSSWELGMF